MLLALVLALFCAPDHPVPVLGSSPRVPLKVNPYATSVSDTRQETWYLVTKNPGQTVFQVDSGVGPLCGCPKGYPMTQMVAGIYGSGIGSGPTAVAQSCASVLFIDLSSIPDGVQVYIVVLGLSHGLGPLTGYTY